MIVSVASGKGGTGKTSLTAAFAALGDSAVVCDLMLPEMGREAHVPTMNQ